MPLRFCGPSRPLASFVDETLDIQEGTPQDRNRKKAFATVGGREPAGLALPFRLRARSNCGESQKAPSRCSRAIPCCRADEWRGAVRNLACNRCSLPDSATSCTSRRSPDRATGFLVVGDASRCTTSGRRQPSTITASPNHQLRSGSIQCPARMSAISQPRPGLPPGLLAHGNRSDQLSNIG